jgi:hypothetical protein
LFVFPPVVIPPHLEKACPTALLIQLATQGTPEQLSECRSRGDFATFLLNRLCLLDPHHTHPQSPIASTPPAPQRPSLKRGRSAADEFAGDGEDQDGDSEDEEEEEDEPDEDGDATGFTVSASSFDRPAPRKVMLAASVVVPPVSYSAPLPQLQLAAVMLMLNYGWRVLKTGRKRSFKDLEYMKNILITPNNALATYFLNTFTEASISLHGESEY